MMNYRHPSEPERRNIRSLCDDIGPVEVLRVIAGIIRNDHPDLSSGGEIAAAIMLQAKILDGQQAVIVAAMDDELAQPN